MSQIRSLCRALFIRSTNIYVSKLRFAVIWLGQIQNLDTGHVYVLGVECGSKRLSLTSHVWISHVTQIGTWTSHVTQMDESCHNDG